MTAMNEMRVFVNEEFGEVRTAIRDEEVWFVASDVCRVLDIGNSRQAIRRLDSDEKGVISNDTSQGRSEVLNCVNEYGLYSLVLGSRKPQARAFKRWITHEVIPSIRKYGGYAASGIYEQPEVTAALILCLMHEQERCDRLQRKLNWAMSPGAAKIRADAAEAAEKRKAKKKEGGWLTGALKAQAENDWMLGDDLPERTAEMFAKAIREMIESGEARVKALPAGRKEDADEEDLLGFADEEYLYVMPQRTYDRVTQRLKANGETFPVTRISMNRCLKALGLVDGDEATGVTTQVKRVGGKPMRLLWIRRSALEKNGR